ncbi:MAG: hypothetical protein PVF17_09650 [Ignavibacteria bacterium]|jgi:REP element-mobilizing transposase RayT
MKYNPERYQRKSIRLKNYDYTNQAWYYVTICTFQNFHWFGSVKNKRVTFSEVGSIANDYWKVIPNHFNYCELDALVVMPNHIHGIIIINERRGVQLNARTDDKFSKISPLSGSLGVIIRTFKGAVKKWCNENGFPKFKWQRNYYEHIIRNEKDLYRIRKYISLNPIKWELDDYYNS